MQTKQHFITNLISYLQIWVPSPSWPDPTRGSGQRSCNFVLTSIILQRRWRWRWRRC